MKRGLTGRYEITSVAGEQLRAFVPHSLPPNPPLDLGDTPSDQAGAAKLDAAIVANLKELGCGE